MVGFLQAISEKVGFRVQSVGWKTDILNIGISKCKSRLAKPRKAGSSGHGR